MSDSMLHKSGSVETLCREIEFPFKRGMETPLIIVAFTRQLVLEIADMRSQEQAINGILRQQQLGPSTGSGELLDRVLDMLNCGNVESMVEQCAELHHLAHELNPEDAYPTDHLIDMLSSCVSAIRFGCDPKDALSSRHAADAAQHVWKYRYGVKLFDRLTPRWEKDWSRHMLTEALVAMALPATKGADECAMPKDPAHD